MNYNKLLALTPLLLLTACGGDEQTMEEATTPGAVIYTYPADGQANVSTKADIVLRFSDPITDEAVADKVQIAPASGGEAIDFSVTPVDNGNSLLLNPADELEAGVDYTITFSENLTAAGNRVIGTPNAVGDQGVQFTTRGSLGGVAALTNLSDTFEIVDSLPDGETFRFMDFSTIRLRASQPIHPESAIYGTTISLRDSGGELVPATLLVKDNMITVDPCTTDAMSDCGSPDDQLNADETYTLSITGLTNLEGDTLDYETTFQPKDTGPTEILYQEIVDSNFSQQSILNGQYVNAVTLNSVLQGESGPSQQTGALYAELGYAPSFPGDTPVPLRVPKGTILESSSLDVLVNGSVPVLDVATGELQKTGTIKVTMTSDAVGYLYPNPYSDSGEAPRHVRLWMDVSMNTEEAQPNASLSQDLLRVELTGIAIVRDGILTIDAIGMVEPNLLGQEFTDSTIAFRIEADTSEQDTAPERPIDGTGPELVSWMPGPDDAIPTTRQAMQRPGDPIILNFDEPLDRDSVPNGFTLFADGTEVTDLRTKLDGTAVVLNPVGGLQHGVDYSLNIEGSLTDLAGNGATTQTLQFNLPPIDTETPSVTQRSPIALTTYPGYPCATRNINLATGSHGFCIDKISEDDSLEYPEGQAPDELPVTTMPADRPITVVFSQSMDLTSIRLGETFRVFKVDEVANETGEVSGRLELNSQRLRFYPDSPWAQGELYEYQLVSQKYESSNTADCSSVICGENGQALQTDMLVTPIDNGGPTLKIYFEGGPARDSVFTPLRNLPVRDTNSNFVVDCNELGGTDCLEPFNHPEDPNQSGRYLPSANAAKLIVNPSREPRVLGSSNSEAKVGCLTDSSVTCPEKKFIYQTYGLNTEVIGPATDPETGKTGVRVLLYPTMLMTTSIEVYLDDGNGLTDVVLNPEDPQVTGPQILRMRYAKGEDGRRDALIPGIIVQGDDGQPVFKTSADLTLDAPELALPLGSTLRHNLFSYPFTLELNGPITFFDDGRMQIEQRTENVPEINVLVSGSDAFISGTLDVASCLLNALLLDFGACSALTDTSQEDGAVVIPLVIPQGGVYLNFISNPVKEIPEQG